MIKDPSGKILWFYSSLLSHECISPFRVYFIFLYHCFAWVYKSLSGILSLFFYITFIAWEYKSISSVLSLFFYIFVYHVIIKFVPSCEILKQSNHLSMLLSCYDYPLDCIYSVPYFLFPLIKFHVLFPPINCMYFHL